MSSIIQVTLSDGAATVFNKHHKLTVQQSTKGWCQTCMGCAAAESFKVLDAQGADVAFVQEESSCFCRMCCNSIRPFTMEMTSGGVAGGAPIATYERPCRPHMAPGKCCCYQELLVSDGNSKAQIGLVRESCYYCIPTLYVVDKDNTVKYHVHAPVCCGCLPNCCAQGTGCGCCRFPFYVFAMVPGLVGTKEETHSGTITKVCMLVFLAYT